MNTTDTYTKYELDIVNRPYIRFILGLIIRWWYNLKYERIRRIARKKGAKIGEGVIMSKNLAKMMNSNCKIGDHVSIQTDKIDTRSPLVIGNNVIIGGGYRDYYCFT